MSRFATHETPEPPWSSASEGARPIPPDKSPEAIHARSLSRLPSCPALLQHYLPTTQWRPGRPGHEERAAGGTELGLRFDLTTTLSLDTAMGRWERGDTGRTTLDGRLGLGWTPHPYLRFDAGTGLGPGADGGAFRLSLNVPLGGPRQRTGWAGLGTFALAGGATAGDLWRPVENVGRIRTIERVAPQDTTVDGVTVRFLQPSAPTGGTAEVEVVLSAPAAEDVRLTVRLAPGSGDNPAVAGVDYVDEPALVTIPAGATTGRATFQLLDNPALAADRTLTVTVARAAWRQAQTNGSTGPNVGTPGPPDASGNLEGAGLASARAWFQGAGTPAGGR